MSDREKTKQQLLQDLADLRQRIDALEGAEAETRRMEESLQQEHNLLRTLIDNLPDYIYVKDVQCRFVAANVAVARIMGASGPDELLGKTDHDFYPDALASQYRAVEVHVLQSGQPVVNREEPGVALDGTQRVILTTQVPLKDRRGAVVGLVGLGRDITDLRRAEEELRRAHDELELRVEQRTAELASANEELTREVAERRRAQEVSRNSEAIYSSLVENLPLHVLRKDADGRFVFANQSFCDLVGKPLAEILGKTDFDFYPEELARKFRHDDHDVLETGRLLETVEENSRDGETRYVEIRKSPVRDAHGKIVGVQGVFWDVTRRKKAEAALERERYLLHALMDNLPHNIYFKDLASRFIRINKAMAAYFGLDDASEAIGKNDFDYFTEEHARQAIADEREILESGQPVVDKEEKETWPDGHTTWVLTTKMPLRDKDGRAVGSFGISRDITERKRAAEALRVAKEAAEAANRAKDAFLANMSHEIRTPLNAVIGMTELVLGTPLSAQQRDFLSTARESGEALLTVINDILDFSKIEAGKFALDCRAFDFRESLGDAMKAFAVRADRKGLELAFDVHPDVPYLVVGDCDRLRQILVNLVGNALKFTEQGEVLLDVALQSQSADDVVLHFTVADTGIGIPESKQSAIFEVFEQVDSTLKRRYGGTGLGLAIASRLVELMGGRIWVESTLGEGSAFHFTARFGLAKGEAVTTCPAELHSLQGLRALVVDDNATNCRILEEILSTWNMSATVVDGASAAMDLLREAQTAGMPYRLVLTDAHMPQIDGFMLAGKIKDDTELNSTVVMMLTSEDRPDAVARCEQLGIAAYLLKPIKQSELLEAVKLALGIALPSKDALLALARERPRRVGPLRILVAEDSPVNQKLATALLETQGHRVTVANNGKEALAALESERFDLVLMDVQMPEMDGLEATAAIRDQEKRTGVHIPIIAMTAHALKGDRERCLEAGMDEYIAKPIHAQELFDLIEGKPSDSAGPAPLPAPAAPEGAAVNWPEALQLVRGDKKLLDELVKTALPEIPRLMAEIRQSLADGNAMSVRLGAHTLKGSLRCFGSAVAFEQLLRLEQMGREGDLTEAESLLAGLDGDIARVVQALTEHLQTPTQ